MLLGRAGPRQSACRRDEIAGTTENRSGALCEPVPGDLVSRVHGTGPKARSDAIHNHDAANGGQAASGGE